MLGIFHGWLFDFRGLVLCLGGGERDVVIYLLEVKAFHIDGRLQKPGTGGSCDCLLDEYAADRGLLIADCGRLLFVKDVDHQAQSPSAFVGTIGMPELLQVLHLAEGF